MKWEELEQKSCYVKHVNPERYGYGRDRGLQFGNWYTRLLYNLPWICRAACYRTNPQVIEVSGVWVVHFCS